MYQKSQIEDNTMTKIKYQRDKQKPSIERTDKTMAK